MLILFGLKDPEWAGVVNCSSSATGTLTKTVPMAGVSAGVSGAQAGLAVSKTLAGSAAGVSSVTGTLGRRRPLAGISNGVSTVPDAELTIKEPISLAGTSSGVSTATASLNAMIFLVGVTGGTATVTGSPPSTFKYLAGSTAGSSSVSGTLRHTGSKFIDLYLEITGTPVFNNNGVDNYKGSYKLPVTVRAGSYAGYVLDPGMAIVGWGHHNEVGETDPYTGGILLTSDLATAPYIDIFTVASGSSPYPWQTSAVVPRVRLGNLNGVAGLSADEWGIALGYDLTDNTATARQLIASDKQFSMKNIDIALWKSGKQTVSIEADGDVKLGTDISQSASTSFSFNAATGTVSLTGYMATGSDLPWGDITGLPSMLDTVNNAGLYLTSSYLGYWDGDSWNAYIDNAGKFLFGNGTDYFTYDGTAVTLKSGGGAVRADADGITLNCGSSKQNRLSFELSGTELAYLSSDYHAGTWYTTTLKQKAGATGAIHAYVDLIAEYDSTHYAQWHLAANGTGGAAQFYNGLTLISVLDSNGQAITGYSSATKALSSGGTPDRNYEGNIEANGNSDVFGLFRSKNRAYLGANVYRDGSTWYYDDGSGVYAYLTEVNEPSAAWNWYSSTNTGNAGGAVSAWTTAMSLSRVGELTVLSKFGCNSKSAQAAYALNPAISGTIDDTYGSDEHAVLDALVAQVNKLRAALVANGICS